MGYRIRPLAAAMAVAFSSTAIWHSAAAQTTPVLNEIVVSASRPQPLPDASVLGSSQLAPMRATTSDTASLLRDVPGISFTARAAFPACRRFMAWPMTGCGSRSTAWI